MSDNWEYIMPRISPEELESRVKNELPGISFRLQHDKNTQVVRMEIARHVEGLYLCISDEMAMSDSAAINWATDDAIKNLRRKAIADYGIQAEIDAQVKTATSEHGKTLMGLLRNHLDKYRTSIKILDENGAAIYVPGDLPWWALEIEQWSNGRQVTA